MALTRSRWFFLPLLIIPLHARAEDLREGSAHYQVVARDGVLNCRQGPGSSSPVLVTFPTGRVLWVEDVATDASGKPWFRVPGGEAEGRPCFVRASSEFLRLSRPSGDLTEISGGVFKVIDPAGLNCRRAPRSGSVVVRSYEMGEFIQVSDIAFDDARRPWFLTSGACWVRASGAFLSEVQYD